MTQQQKKPWMQFFDNHAAAYMDNCFTKNTQNEVTFLIDELGLKPGETVLDVGCGTGRHAVELARRGYKVTGIDLSPAMLAEAARAAQQAQVKVEFVNCDATSFDLGRQFDGLICLCEGAFGLLESEDDALEQPLAILRNVKRSLRPGRRSLFTVLNGYKMIRESSQSDVEQGKFDPLSMSVVGEHSPVEGLEAVRLRERSFVPTELTLLFRVAGLRPLHIWGGTAGSWNRGRIGLDEYEIMIVAENPAAGGN